MSASASERLRARRFGWASITAWVLAGLALEAALGFKLPSVVEDELARTLLRLGHAHGVGLSLVVLVYSAAGVPLLAHRADGGRAVGRLLRVAAVLVPVGFGGSAFGHPEGDPTLVIALVPVGAVVLLVGLGRVVAAAFRRDPDGHDPVDR